MLAIRSNAFETRLITMIALLLECRELSVLSLTPPRISESDGTKKSLEVMTVTGRALMDIKRIDDDDEFDADTTEFDKLFESFSREAIS